jgi:transcriptional regulator with XRE-family HTH domain
VKGLGQKIKRFREQAGLSQTQLGDKLGISYQQIQKYERGVNRVSVETLMRMARALGQPVVAFLEAGDWAGKGSLVAESRPEYGGGGGPVTREERELLKSWRELTDEKVRSACMILLRAAAKKR